MNRNAPLFLLLAAIALSLYAHSAVLSEFVMPTYGNTMIHVANARHLVETGFYPIQDDYSYGGGAPNLYVPLFRFAYAEAVLLTGLSFDLVGRLFVLLFALLLPLGFYLLASRAWGEWAGAAAAFASCLVPELLIYTVRPLPQALGLALLPVAFYFLAKNNWRAAPAATLLVTLVHQEAGVFLVGCAFAYAFARVAHASWHAKKLVFPAEARLGFACWTCGVAAYFAWHFFVMGNLAVFDLAQFQHHEGGRVTFDLLLTKTGKAVLLFGALGALAAFWRALRSRVPNETELLLLACVGAGLFACFNDLVGINVFMDRFIVFLALPLVCFAALGLKEAYAFAERVSTRVNRVTV
ncbi:MAG: hypothetical protein WC607_04940 [Candidatus Micrarchaeia archaeon]